LQAATTALTSSSVASSKDLNGNWIFLGQVGNSAKVAYSNVAVTVNLYSADQKIVATKTAYLDFDSIAPGQTLPFRVWFDSGPDYDHAVTTVSGTIDPSAQVSSLTYVVITSDYTTSGDYHIRAVVQNDSKAPISRPTYVIALYQQNGKIFDYSSGFLTLDKLNPGASVSIDVTFFNPATNFSRYRAFTSG
ncbi:MAG TPA: FxLYD domain-containing protein, partial [Nitrolancea sp.]|nr:FxLYD domain-containing protein [Nitrolancea sp.]